MPSQRVLNYLEKRAMFGRDFLEKFREQAGAKNTIFRGLLRDKASGETSIRGALVGHTPEEVARYAGAARDNNLGARLDRLSDDAEYVRRLRRERPADGDTRVLDNALAELRHRGAVFKAKKNEARVAAGLPSWSPAPVEPPPRKLGFFDRIDAKARKESGGDWND